MIVAAPVGRGVTRRKAAGRLQERWPRMGIWAHRGPSEQQACERREVVEPRWFRVNWQARRTKGEMALTVSKISPCESMGKQDQHGDARFGFWARGKPGGMSDAKGGGTGRTRGQHARRLAISEAIGEVVEAGKAVEPLPCCFLDIFPAKFGHRGCKATETRSHHR